VAAGTLVQLRVPGDLLERIDAAAEGTTRTAWLLGPGTPSPGVLCMGPRCHQRDTSRYGLRGLPLCTACAHAATGQHYSRTQPDLPPAWRIRRGTTQPGKPATATTAPGHPS
jgi:hypothetical protein